MGLLPHQRGQRGDPGWPDFVLVRARATLVEFNERHNQPPLKPARRKPLTMYGQVRISFHNNPVR